MEYTTKLCPHCGKAITILDSTKRQYGSPFRTCPKCNKGYTDKSFIELACTTVHADDVPCITRLSIVSIIFSSFFLLLAFIQGLDAPYGLLFLVSGLLFMFGSIYLTCKDIKTYHKRVYDFNVELKNSRNRLSNPVYAKALAAIGCYVPPVYLQQNAKGTVKSFSPNNTAKSVQIVLWRNTLDFIKKGWDQDDLPDLLYFWTALYYSVYDILQRNSLTTDVMRELHAFLYDFEIKRSVNSDVIDAAIHFQGTMFNTITETVSDPLSKDGMAEILELAYLVCSPDDDPAEISPIDAITMFEYTTAVTNAVSEISKLLSKELKHPGAATPGP